MTGTLGSRIADELDIDREDGMGEAVHPYNGEPVKIPSWEA